jgi:Suppressor of fused protein (SUFU)
VDYDPRIRRYEQALPPEPVPTGWAGQELIEAHVERHIGPGTKLCGALIAPPSATPADDIEGADGPVAMRAAYFLYDEEMQLKLDRGYDALADTLDEIEVLEIVEPDRPSAA